MGNNEHLFCQNTNYLCNKNSLIRKSLSLPKGKIGIKNNSTNNIILANKQFLNISKIENKVKILNCTNLKNINNTNIKSFKCLKENSKQFIKLNENSRNEIKLNNSAKTSLKMSEKQKRKIPYKFSSDLNIINKKKLFLLKELNHNINYKNINNEINFNNKFNVEKENSCKNIKNNSKHESLSISSGEEDTIINYTEKSNKTSQKQEKEEKNKPLENKDDINFDKKNNIKENENLKVNESGLSKDKNELSKDENELSHDEIELFKKSFQLKQKEYSGLINGIKIRNFKNLDKGLIKTIFNKEYIDNADHNHPLNVLLLDRHIKSSLCPLDQDSFNILKYKEDNSILYGFFENGLPKGIIKFIINEKKKIIYEGEYEEGFPKGYGLYSIKNDGKYYEGIWDKQILLGIETWNDGTVYMGEFKNNKKDGYGLYRWSDGTVYLGEWKNDNMEGFCYIKYANERGYEGQMKNGFKNGYGEFTFKPSRKYIGYYVNDLKDGFGIYIFNIRTFQVYVGFWHKGKMEGIGMMINGEQVHIGKWSEGTKTEKFKNQGELKMKFNSTLFNIGANLINKRSIIIRDNMAKLNFNKKESSNILDKTIIINKAKIEVEGCINFMCKDIKVIKAFIINAFYKSNESS